MTGYCTNCGAQLDANGMCPNCGAMYSVDETYAQQKNQIFIDDNGVYVDANGNPIPPDQFQPVDISGYYAQPQEYAPNPEYQSQQEYVPNFAPSQPKAKAQFTMPLPIIEWLECAKAFFIQDPPASSEKVMQGKHYSWAIFAALNAFAAALCTSGIVGNGFNWLLEKLFGSYSFMLSMITEYDFGKMFLLFIVSLIFFAVLFFASSACEYVFLSSMQKKTSFDDIFKMVSISYFPMTIVCAAAFLFSFFLLPMSAVLLIAGFIASFMLLNENTKKFVGELPFWGMVLNNIAQIVIAMVFISIAMSIAL